MCVRDQLFRLLRLGRVIRVFTAFKALQKLVSAISAAIFPGICLCDKYRFPVFVCVTKGDADADSIFSSSRVDILGKVMCVRRQDLVCVCVKRDLIHVCVRA